MRSLVIFGAVLFQLVLCTASAGESLDDPSVEALETRVEIEEALAAKQVLRKFIEVNAAKRQLNSNLGTRGSAEKSERLSMRELESLLTTEQNDEIQVSFSTFDQNGDGSMTKEELTTALAYASVILTDDELDQLIARLDENENGQVDYSEYYAIKAEHAAEGDGRVLRIFTEYAQGDSLLDREEITAMLTENLGFPVSDSLLDSVMSIADGNDTGKLKLLRSRGSYSNYRFCSRVAQWAPFQLQT